MNLDRVFSILLHKKQVSLQLALEDEQRLRVSLVKKFSRHKKELDSIGVLDEELEKCSLSVDRTESTGVSTFHIRPRKVRTRIEYTLIGDSE